MTTTIRSFKIRANSNDYLKIQMLARTEANWVTLMSFKIKIITICSPKESSNSTQSQYQPRWDHQINWRCPQIKSSTRCTCRNKKNWTRHQFQTWSATKEAHPICWTTNSQIIATIFQITAMNKLRAWRTRQHVGLRSKCRAQTWSRSNTICHHRSSTSHCRILSADKSPRSTKYRGFSQQENEQMNQFMNGYSSRRH